MSKSTVYTMRTCGYKKCSPCYVNNYEAKEIDYVTKYLDRVAEAGKLNGTFIDVGAHVGLWSLQMSEWYQCRYAIIPIIYALECESANYTKLRRNAVQAETGIIPAQIAAWHRDEWLYIKQHAHPARHQVVSISQQGSERMRVMGKALDDMASAPENRQIDVIKIDVEGAELNVLNGARALLDENEQLLVVIEYSVGHFVQYGYTCEQVTGFMQANGYRFARPVDKKTADGMIAGQVKRVMFVKGEIS